MIILYHVAMTRSVRVRWALEELGLAYEIATLNREAGDLASPEYLQLNPFGRVPAITDQSGNDQIVLFESGAIIEYLLERYDDGTLKPQTGTDAWAQYIQWIHAAETFSQPVGLFIQHGNR